MAQATIANCRKGVLQMSDGLPESEFGGKMQSNGFYPPPHRMSAAEKLRSVYQTGDDTGLNDPDPSWFQGLLPFEDQYAKREAEGAFEHGEYDPMKSVD